MNSHTKKRGGGEIRFKRGPETLCDETLLPRERRAVFVTRLVAAPSESEPVAEPPLRPSLTCQQIRLQRQLVCIKKMTLTRGLFPNRAEQLVH